MPRRSPVNETLARQLWNRLDVVGETLGRSRIQIVGVLADARFGNPAERVQPMAFRLLAPHSSKDLVIVRSLSSARTLASGLRQKEAQHLLPFEVASVDSLADLWGRTQAADLARTVLAVATACMVALLAGLGFYGTQRYLVQAGRREYAIRSSLGAGPRALFRLVLGRGLALAAPGLLTGVLLAGLLVSWLKTTVISGQFSTALILAFVSLAGVTLVIGATVGPAARAASVPSASVLREE